jgi:hypothetical protein
VITRLPTRRWCAVLAVGTAVMGAAAVTVAVADTAAGYGYVSEAGAPGAPLRAVYRFGIAGLAIALALAAVALRPLVPAASLALVGAAPLAMASGAVSCTPGCPLPPYQTPSGADLVHAVASSGALLLTAAAIILTARAPDIEDLLRRVSRFGLGLVVPLEIAAGLATLAVGRGYVSGVLERAAIIAAIGWVAVVSLLRCRDCAD